MWTIASEPYEPLDGSMLRTLDLGTWSASGRPDIHVVVTMDRRLLSWYVQLAAQLDGLTYVWFPGDLPLAACLEVVP